MKKKIQTAIVIFFLITFVHVSLAGIPVTCINCSTTFTQLMEYVLQIEELMEGIKRYEELAAQTENMVTNTMNLPSNLKSNLTAQLKEVVSNIEKLNTYKADFTALQTIFTDTWPELKEFKVDGVLMSDQIKTRLKQFESATEKMDNILQSNFQLSGKQLQDMEDSGEFDDYVNDLLSSKEGRQQAIEAGNQINALTVHEMRQTRALLANYVQAQSAALAQEQNEAKLNDADLQQETEIGVDVNTNIRSLP